LPFQSYSRLRLDRRLVTALVAPHRAERMVTSLHYARYRKISALSHFEFVVGDLQFLINHRHSVSEQRQ